MTLIPSGLRPVVWGLVGLLWIMGMIYLIHGEWRYVLYARKHDDVSAWSVLWSAPVTLLLLWFFWTGARDSWRWIRDWHRDRRQGTLRLQPGRYPQGAAKCTSCGYDLRGLPARGRCPECGNAYLTMPRPRH